MSAQTPFLDCDDCGAPLVRSGERGRFDRDGNFIKHRLECRCRWCTWIFWESETVYECACGSRFHVGADSGFAYLAREEE